MSDTREITTESGVPLGEHWGRDARDAVRNALIAEGYTTHPNPRDDGSLVCKGNAPKHIACDYQADGEMVRVRPLCDY